MLVEPSSTWPSFSLEFPPEEPPAEPPPKTRPPLPSSFHTKPPADAWKEPGTTLAWRVRPDAILAPAANVEDSLVVWYFPSLEVVSFVSSSVVLLSRFVAVVTAR